MAVNDGFQLVIQVNSKGWTLYLDTCMEKRINASATIPTQPLQNGDTVSDHMYRNPDEFSINGTFSEFGNNENDSTYNDIVSKDCDRITAIQTVFERIKDEGLLCDLTTIERGANGNYRFKIRKNMALQTITWTELQVSLKYSFTFKEIMTVNIQEYKAEIDSDLPNIYLPETKSLGMLMTEEAKDGEVSPVIAITMKALLEAGAISKYDAEFIVNGGSKSTGPWGDENLYDSNKTNVGVNSWFSQFFAGFVNMNANGTVDVWSGIMNAIPLVGFIYRIIKASNYAKETSNAQATFRLVVNLDSHIHNGVLNLEEAIADPNTTINKDEAKRLMDFLNGIKNIVNSATANVTVYDIAKSIDDNNDREVILNIENNPYYISFTRNVDNSPPWNIQIKGLSTNGTPIDLNGFNGTRVTTSKICTTIEDMCDEMNALFWDSTDKHQVYLYQHGTEHTYSASSINRAGEYSRVVTKSPETFLCNFYLVVVKGKLQDELQKIYDKIYSALSKAGYN